MITIQRVRVRWTAASRGAPQAVARRGLNRPVRLPTSWPAGDVAIHEVLADEATGYHRQDQVRAGDLKLARDTGLRLRPTGGVLTVDRQRGWAAFPRKSADARLFSLAPGQTGRYRANFRFCFADLPVYYEDWTVHVSNGPVPADRFLGPDPDVEVDARVHLYGGRAR